MIGLKKYIGTLLLLLLATTSAFAQKAERDYIRKGNRAYKDSVYVDAEVNYRKALEANPKSTVSMFNLGNTLLQQNKVQEAMEQYVGAARVEKDKMNLAQIYHNMGVIFHAQKDYAKAVEAYKESLRNNPKDDETRYNLALAQKMLKDQQQNQQNQNQDQSQQEQQKNQDQQSQQNQQQQDQQQQQPQQQENNEEQGHKEDQDHSQDEDRIRSEGFLDIIFERKSHTDDISAVRFRVVEIIYTHGIRFPDSITLFRLQGLLHFRACSMVVHETVVFDGIKDYMAVFVDDSHPQFRREEGYCGRIVIGLRHDVGIA